MKLPQQLPNLRSQLGQGMTEYIIIVALIAIAAIGSFQYFGQTARNQAAAAATELAGGEGQADTRQALRASRSARAEGRDDKDMANFSDNEQGGAN